MRVFFCLMFILATNCLVAQPSSRLSISKSLEYEDEVKTDSILSFYTTQQGHTGIVRDAKKNIVFDIFDANLTKVHTQVIERHKKESIVGDLFFGNEIRIFTEYAIKKNERILHCHIFNIKDYTHNKIQVYKTIIDGRQTLYSEMKEHQTAFAISPEGTYLVIATDNIDKDDDSFLVRVFNSMTLQKIYQNTFLENSDQHFELKDLVVDNNSVVYSLGKLFLNGRSEKKRGEANYEFVLNRITNKSSNTLSVVLDNQHIETLSISLMKDRVHLLGLFSEKNISKVKGGCNFIIDPEALTITSKFEADLPVEVFEEIYGSARARKKRGKELSNFNIDYILTDDSGNTYILAEEFYITSSNYYVPMQGGIIGGSQIPHYDDILILKFSREGNLEWGRGLFKKSNEHSYNAFLRNGELHVILNSGKDLMEKKDGRTKISKGWLESSSLYNFTFSKEGEVSHNKILDYNNRYRYLPQLGSYHNDKFIMMSSGRKRKHFAILD